MENMFYSSDYFVSIQNNEFHMYHYSLLIFSHTHHCPLLLILPLLPDGLLSPT